MKLHKYKIFCQTDNKWEKIIKNENESAPTACPVNTNHVVAVGSEVIEEIIDTESRKDSEGAVLSRKKITYTGWSYQLHGIEFTTSSLNPIYSKDIDGNDTGYSTIKLYDSSDLEITDPLNEGNAVKTVVDFEPTHDYEMMGGMFKIKSALTQDVRLWVIGVPDIPAASGGSKIFISNINLRYVGLEEGINVDGRVPKLLTYSATNHTNKLRLILKHPAGYQADMHIIFEFFKP